MRDRGIESVIAVLEVVGLSYVIVVKGEFVPWAPFMGVQVRGDDRSCQRSSRNPSLRCTNLNALSFQPPSVHLLPLSVAGQEGLEPPTTGLEIRCSIQLSYCPVRSRNMHEKAERKTTVFENSRTKTARDELGNTL